VTLSVLADPRHAPRAPAARGRGVELKTAMGPRTNRSRGPCEVHHPAAVVRRDHRHRRCHAAVEPEEPRSERLSVGSVRGVAPSLDGVWLNAPYLHNGSVPTLSDLLEPPANRPGRFWRGYDVYDQAGVGFVSDGVDAQRSGTPFDATRPGNGNGGHAYGTTL